MVPKLILDSTNRIPFIFRQRYLNFIFDESKKIYKNLEEACEKAALEEKSLYDRSKTKPIYSNLAVNLIKNLRKSSSTLTTTTSSLPSTSSTTTPSSTNKKINNTIATGGAAVTSTISTKTKIISSASTTTTTTGSATTTTTTLVNGKTKKVFSHAALLAGPKSSTYSINKKKTLTIKDLSGK